MPRYTVQHAYRSYRDGQQFGPWRTGDEIELEETAAEWINRDSPDTLEPVDEPEPEPEPKPDPAPEPKPDPEPEPTPDPAPKPDPAPAASRRQRGVTKR